MNFPQDFADSPYLVIHADWGLNPKKRWMAHATFLGDHYLVHPAKPVGDPQTLLKWLQDKAGPDGGSLIGFDFPIGIPYAYAQKVGIHDFITALPQFGQGDWKNFYRVAESPDQISLWRPFYPYRPGGSRHEHILNKLGISSIDDLRRACEKAPPLRRKASPLFWTLGAQQVGKAALHGWQNVIVPGLQDPTLDLSIWPYSGTLQYLSKPGRIIIAETYPAEFFHHLQLIKPGRRFSKRNQSDRSNIADTLIEGIISSNNQIHIELEKAILDGFGPSKYGEDAFAAVIGLIGMLKILVGTLSLYEPPDERIRCVEGWIFGLAT